MKKKEIFLLAFCLLFLRRISLAGEKKEEFPVVASKSFKFSGFAQFQYDHWDEGSKGFLIRRVRAGLAGDILEKIHYKLQLDAVKSPILLDAQVEFDLTSRLTLRIGQFKVPFSLENLTSSSALDTINRSQTVEKLCPGRDIGSQGRDIGAILIGKFSKIEWTLGVFNGSGINKVDANEQKDIAGRLAFQPLNFLTLAVSFYDGRYSPASGIPPTTRDRMGIEIFFLRSPLSLKGEYIWAKDSQVKKDGLYIQAGYFLIPKKLQFLVKFDSYDKNKDIATDRSNFVTIGLNWFFTEKTKFLINYEWHKEESGNISNFALLAQFQAGF